MARGEYTWCIRCMKWIADNNFKRHEQRCKGARGAEARKPIGPVWPIGGQRKEVTHGD